MTGILVFSSFAFLQSLVLYLRGLKVKDRYREAQAEGVLPFTEARPARGRRARRALADNPGEAAPIGG